MKIKEDTLNVARSGITTYLVSFETDSDGVRELVDIDTKKALRAVISPYRHKRSLDANRYYWSLNGKLSDAMRISKEECHLLMLQRYGQTDTYDDGSPMVITIKADVPAEVIAEKLDAYISPIKNGIVGNKEFTHYRVLKGTHKYNTKEMSVFIDGVISECKELGIETLSPDEVERLKQQWKVET